MFIIEYWQGGKLHTLMPKDKVEADFAEKWLLALRTVGLIMIWGPL